MIKKRTKLQRLSEAALRDATALFEEPHQEVRFSILPHIFGSGRSVSATVTNSKKEGGKALTLVVGSETPLSIK